MYYIHTPQEFSEWWQYGYKQVVLQVQKYENRYDKIIVTYKYDQPYIFFLFYNLTNPQWYQKNCNCDEIERSRRSFGKFEFRNIDWEKDKKNPKTLIIASPAEIPDDVDILNEIKFLDGTTAFKIIGT